MAASGVTAIGGWKQAGMAKKKDRAFFVCPRWNEVADAPRAGSSDATAPIPVSGKVLTAIKGGQPIARSTLRKALLAARQASGSVIDVDA